MTLFALGCTYLFASLGVFVRDLNQFVGILITITMFLSPVFYSLDAAPTALKSYLALNPLCDMIELFRRTTVLGELPSWKLLALVWTEGFAVALLGFAVFTRMKRAFADVM
jgi:lipopolysaccharide transport system permease protein